MFVFISQHISVFPLFSFFLYSHPYSFQFSLFLNHLPHICLLKQRKMFMTNKVLNCLKTCVKSQIRSCVSIQRRSFSTAQQNIEYNVVEPIYKLAFPERTFPDTIAKPHYAADGKPRKHYEGNLVKSMQDIKQIAEACRIAKTICMTVGKEVRPGLTCEQIDDRVYELCLEYGVYPSPLNYSGFPKCVTT